MLIRRIILIIVVTIFSFSAFAQNEGNTVTLDKVTIKSGEKVHPPQSDDDYWRLIFHTDSINDPRELKEYYDAAFTDDEKIYPIHLTMAAKKMLENGDSKAYVDYIEHRMRMENDYYEENYDKILPKADIDKFKERSLKYNYDVKLKDELESIYEEDQHYRTQWWLAMSDTPNDSIRNNTLGELTWNKDINNIAKVEEILKVNGFPSKTKVGETACKTVFLVIQHADIEIQKRYLPLIEQAAGEGNIPLKYVAYLQDRINVREGRPQKYGTQYDSDNNLCPLVDKSKANEWRKEVGLPPLSL